MIPVHGVKKGREYESEQLVDKIFKVTERVTKRGRAVFIYWRDQYGYMHKDSYTEYLVR